MSRCGVARYFIQFCIFFIIFCHQLFCFRTLRRFLRQTQITQCFITLYIRCTDRIWHPGWFLRFGAGNKHSIKVNGIGYRACCTRAGTVDNHQIFVIQCWRPCAARPVHQQCFLAGFGCYIPQWLCFHVSRIDCSVGDFQVLTTQVKVLNAVGHWVRTGSQSCPHRRCNGWVGT